MTKNSWLISSLIILGVLSVALSIFLSTQTEKQRPGSRMLARAELNLGKVFVLRKNLTQKEQLKSRTSLYVLDSVETAADGDATLEFDSAFRIRILENSLITMDQEGEHTVLIVKRGDVQVENFGREGTVYISQEGSRWEATDYETVYRKKVAEGSTDSTPSLDSTIKATATPPPSTESLTASFIEDTLKLQRNSFFKCYTQLLQKTPGVVGQASVNFTISPSGKVTQASIASSSLQDADFKKCLLEAVKRVEFQPFEGGNISTIFPLKFE